MTLYAPSPSPSLAALALAGWPWLARAGLAYIAASSTHLVVCVQMVEAFTQCAAVVEAHKGGAFSLLSGHISGEFLECVRPAKIVQKWRLKSWPEGMYVCI